MKINFIANTGITRTFGNNENKNSIAKQKTEAQNNVSSPILKPLYYQRYPLASTKDMLEIEKVIQKMQEGGPYENDTILQNIKRIKEEKRVKKNRICCSKAHRCSSRGSWLGGMLRHLRVFGRCC